MLLQDPDLRELVELELEALNDKLKICLSKIEVLTSKPKKEELDNYKNTIIEIQAGEGGDESCLFASILFEMYSKFAKKKGWTIEINDFNGGNQGGFKKISFVIEGPGAYGFLRYESGNHKIQRVSPTDTSKRMQTSIASVVVMPESETQEIKINKQDVKMDTFRSGGPGGQAQNKTESGVRLTHLPTGTVVSIREGRSQTKNLIRAWKLLDSQIIEQHRKNQADRHQEAKQDLRGDGSRGGCIRTYNFPQDRLTDHRIGLTLHNLDKLLAGNIEELLETLQNKE